jgi:hypothetical protein
MGSFPLGRIVVLSLCFGLVFQAAAQSQTTGQAPTRDPQAIAILAKSLAASGGASILSGVHDYTAIGSITYFWAGEEVRGTVTLKGRGSGQFRLEATIAGEVRSWATNNGTGFVKELNGSVRSIPYQNSVNFGNLAFPVVHLAAALQDPSTSISYIGLEERSGQQVQHVRIQKIFTIDFDPRGDFSKLTVRDFYFDPGTFLVLSILDTTHPDTSITINLPHEIRFSNYQTLNGTVIPFSLSEISGGQRTYSIQLDQVSFNAGLQDVDFEE